MSQVKVTASLCLQSPAMRVFKLQQQLQLELILFVDSTTVLLRHCCTLSDEIGTVT